MIIDYTCRYKEWVNREGDDIDIAKALLAAAKANHVKIVDTILRKDDDAFQDDSKLSVLHVYDELNFGGFYVWKVAVREGLSCIFEVKAQLSPQVHVDCSYRNGW